MTLLKKLGIFIWNSLSVVGLVSICAGLAGLYYFSGVYHVSPAQLISKAFEEYGIEKPAVVTKLLEPPDRYADYRFQGILKPDFPRILYKTASDIQRIRHRYTTDEHYKKTVDAHAKGASAWFCKKDIKEGKAAIGHLVGTQAKLPRETGDYGNALSLALSYDLLHDHPSWTPEQIQQVKTSFKTYLTSAISLLNGESVSLWHGRFQLASAAFVTASVMEITTPEDRHLLAKAQAHFLEAVEALRITGGWPEGYNYWINNRAYPFALACLAHMNSVDAPNLNAKIKTVLETVGLWTIYGTRPDGRFALFGDTGPRNDLNDDTQRFIDLVLLGTGNPVFKYYSAYLGTRPKGTGYYHKYRWSMPVFRGLPENDYPASLVYKDLSFLNNVLPNSRIFGAGAFNQVFIRSGWGLEDSFISFRAGNTFAHHGHYQAGHFTLDKYAPLALTSGTYGGYTSPHRLNYYIRTIAGNSLLIQKPGEIVKPNHFFTDNVSAGGQRIIIPTGSAVASVDNWTQNLTWGQQYKGASLKAFDNSHPDFVFISSDLTPAYAEDKARKVTRRLCYLTQEDLLILHDEVAATPRHLPKKWLLHTWSKPETRSETLITGTVDNGILQSADRQARMVHENGSLHMAVILPAQPTITKIGGPDFRYYVETDGDDTHFDGMNMTGGAKENSWFDSGMWRLELTAQNHDTATTQFLVLLKPGHKSNAGIPQHYPVKSPDVAGVQVGHKVIIFVPEKPHTQFSYVVNTREDSSHIVFGLPKNRCAVITINGKNIQKKISAAGILIFDTKKIASQTVTIRVLA